VAFISALFIVVAVGMLLFGFVFISQSEVGFAAFNRNSTEALGLAEAGAQEAIKRLMMFGAIPGITTGTPCSGLGVATFSNSLAGSTQGGCGAVTYQAPLQGYPGVFPILSKATFAGVQRTVRILEQAIYKTGFGATVLGPQVAFTGDAWTTTGDTYAQSSISFQQYKKSPPCASGATATNLISPQVIGGTTISSGNGPGVNACGVSGNKATGPYTTECSDGSLAEVAPTACIAHDGRASDGSDNPLPANWHPMTPTGMSSGDFTALIAWINANPSTASTYQLGTVQATQSGTGVTYTSAGTYTPSYWSSIPTTNGKVMLVTSGKPFCVNSSSGNVQLPSPDVTGTCAAGYHYYGNQTGGTPATTRFLDWGGVADDLTRAKAQTFFQPSTCSTCNGGGPNGNQNGIRYIPILPTVNVLALACLQNINPGINVFDNAVNDLISCANPPTTTHSTTNESFTGTKTSPEFLVVDNGAPGGTSVSIAGSGTGNTDCSTNTAPYSWGVIMATGDLSFTGNTIFTGFIYTPGTVSTAGTVVFHGGIYAANIVGTGAPATAINSTGNAKYCSTDQASLPLNSQFFTFTATSWQDRPYNQP